MGSVWGHDRKETKDNNIASGCGIMAVHMLWEHEGVGSTPATPTNIGNGNIQVMIRNSHYLYFHIQKKEVMHNGLYLLYNKQNKW